MTFTIILRNDGDTGTVRVYQQINTNESAELYNDKIEVGETAVLKALKTEDYGDDGSNFAWHHGASGLSNEEYVRAGDELRVK